MEMKNKSIEDFEKALKRDRERSNRYPENKFFKALAKNTEECLNQLRAESKKLDLKIRNN